MISRRFWMKQKSLKEEVDSLKLRKTAELAVLKNEVHLPFKPKKGAYKELPDDVTSIPSADLGSYLAVYEAEAAWTRYLIAQRELDLEGAKIIMDYVYSKLISAKSGKSYEQKAAVLGDAFYVECKLEYASIEAELKYLQVSLDANERYSKVISREITNRRMIDDSFRGGSLNKNDEVFHDHRKQKQ